jgi:serine/threonine protein kinase
VEKYCQGTYTGKVPPDCHALFQMADGLQHLHSKDFAHRDISPNNVLIKLINDEAVMKISDFGVCKPASETGSFSMSDDGCNSHSCKGTWFYIAPELLIPMNNEQKYRGHINNDIFSLGCVFFRFLTKGGHPFFDPSENANGIILNILNNKQFLEGN